ncbi:MAG: hypothetical protein ACON34_05865 [Flavobacteriales bacterium]
MRLLLFGAALLLTVSSVAQSGRQLRPLYNLDGGRYLHKGWHFAPGLTYMIPTAAGRFNDRLRTETEGQTDTLYIGDFSAAGSLGVYLEVGRHWFIDYYLLDYIDAGIGFKQLRGRENFTGSVLTDTGLMEVDNRGEFKFNRITGFVNFSNIVQLTDNTFIQNSAGANLDYRLGGGVTYEGPTTGMLQAFPPDFTADIHWKFGFGWRPEWGVLIIPSIETPILTLAKFDDGKSTTQVFSTRYRPIIVSLRVLLFDKRKAQDCVGQSDGTTKHELWGKEMRRGRRRE